MQFQKYMKISETESDLSSWEARILHGTLKSRTWTTKVTHMSLKIAKPLYRLLAVYSFKQIALKSQVNPIHLMSAHQIMVYQFHFQTFKSKENTSDSPVVRW